MLNILVTGSNGQLGSEIKEEVTNVPIPNAHFLFTNKDDLDICNDAAIKEYIEAKNIDTIINCAAYTAVDKAEEDQVNADKINHLAVKSLASISKEKNIHLIHVSTDYVFDGTNYKPYIESDVTNPNGIYGKTKLDGEVAMIKINPENSIIIRTSWVYSSHGANFVKTMLRIGNKREQLGVIFDQVGTPTYAKDLAQSILAIIPKMKNEKVEIYHYSNEGVCSWYDFAKTIFELSDVHCQVNPIETKEYPTPAKRPHYSILNKTKIKKDFDITIPYWRSSLIACLKQIEAHTN